MSTPVIVAIDRIDFSHGPWTWPFAEQRRDAIDASFAQRRTITPQLWNGRVLLVNDFRLDGATLRGSFFETDFASFIAWRDWGCPDHTIRNVFAMGAIRSTDGGYILGVMAEHTVNPGRVYFPAGTPDPDDIAGDKVDLAGSVFREVAEETGLTEADFVADPDWTAVMLGPRIALMRVLQAHEDAASLRAKVLDHISRQKESELADIRIVRSRRDFDPNMPDFMTAFLTAVLAD